MDPSLLIEDLEKDSDSKTGSAASTSKSQPKALAAVDYTSSTSEDANQQSMLDAGIAPVDPNADQIFLDEEARFMACTYEGLPEYCEYGEQPGPALASKEEVDFLALAMEEDFDFEDFVLETTQDGSSNGYERSFTGRSGGAGEDQLNETEESTTEEAEKKRTARPKEEAPNSTNRNNCLSYERWSEEYGMCVGCQYRDSMYNVIDSSLRTNNAHIADAKELVYLKIKLEEEGKDWNKLLGDCDNENQDGVFYGPGHTCRVMCHRNYVPINSGAGTRAFRCVCDFHTGCRWFYGGSNGDNVLQCVDPITDKAQIQTAAETNEHAQKVLDYISRKELQAEKVAFKNDKVNRRLAQRVEKNEMKLADWEDKKNPIIFKYYYLFDMDSEKLSQAKRQSLYIDLIKSSHLTILAGITEASDAYLADWCTAMISRLKSLDDNHFWKFFVTNLTGSAFKQERTIIFFRYDKIFINTPIQLENDSRFTFNPFLLQVFRRKYKNQRYINENIPKGVNSELSLIVFRGDETLKKNFARKNAELMALPELESEFTSKIQAKIDATGEGHAYYNSTMIVGNFFADSNCQFMSETDETEFSEKFKNHWSFNDRWNFKNFAVNSFGDVLGKEDNPCHLNQVIVKSRREVTICDDVAEDKTSFTVPELKEMSGYFRPIGCTIN